MTFLFPLGLLGLLGIPVIIVIYILQSKFTEQTVTSTYLWHLSDKFLKRKNPLNGLTGLISLILQLLTVAVISLIVAHPVITLPGAAYDYCFILDASGSMNTVEGEEKTRFDLAKEEIERVIKDAKSGSSYTLISVSNETVKVINKTKNKDTALELLNNASPSDTAVDYAELLNTAQGAFEENSSARLYLVTDKSYQKHENIEVLTVGTPNVENHGVFDVQYSHSGSTLTVTANVVSYTSDKALELRLSVDGKTVDTVRVKTKAGKTAPITLEAPIERFDSLTVSLSGKDCYELDNSVTVYNLESDKAYNTLIVSEEPFFLQAVLDALTDSKIETVSPDEYEDVTATYGLYIFDSYTPEALPDASVWLINADRNLDGTGFSILGRTELRGGAALDKSTSTSTGVRKLLDKVDGENIFISGNYIKYNKMYLSFSTLFSYDSNPLIFAGANELGNRQVVFGFDLHKSDFALSTDFVSLMGNLLEYSFPNVIDNTNFTVGEETIVNIVANSSKLKAISPSGKDIYMESDGTTATLPMNEVGTYVISLSIAGKESSYRIYAGAHPEESRPALTEDDFSLSGQKGNAMIDGEYDPTILLFILLAVLFIADWGVYCYEKYQLR